MFFDTLARLAPVTAALTWPCHCVWFALFRSWLGSLLRALSQTCVFGIMASLLRAATGSLSLLIVPLTGLGRQHEMHFCRRSVGGVYVYRSCQLHAARSRAAVVHAHTCHKIGLEQQGSDGCASRCGCPAAGLRRGTRLVRLELVAPVLNITSSIFSLTAPTWPNCILADT